MAHLTSLTEIGQRRRAIGNYIITNNAQVLANADDTGDIIIYVSDGEPFSDNDFDNAKYHDLYIGDEHVAGGFGFKDIKTRNNILTNVSDLLTRVSQAETKIQYIIDNENTSENEGPNLNIESRYSYIETSNGKYWLNYDNETGNLRVLYDELPNLSNIKVTYDANKIAATDNNPINLFLPLNLSNIEFIYSGTEDPVSFYIYYTKNANGKSIDYDFAGKYDTPINLNSLSFSFPLKNVTKEYVLLNPNKNPNTREISIKIDCQANQIFASNGMQDEGDYELKVVITDAKGRKCIGTLAKFQIMSPIGFIASKMFPTDPFTNTILGNDSEKFYDMKISHGLTPTFGWAFVPMGIMNDLEYDDPIFYYNGDFKAKVKWLSYGDPKEYQGKRYKVYISPELYIGDINWQIQVKFK